MKFFTATDLRTKTPELAATLKDGQAAYLVHRSQVIGEFKPKKIEKKSFHAKSFLAAVKRLNLPKLSDTERERIYRKHLMEKYGHHFS